jgi:hypothetical protein
MQLAMRLHHIASGYIWAFRKHGILELDGSERPQDQGHLVTQSIQPFNFGSVARVPGRTLVAHDGGMGPSILHMSWGAADCQCPLMRPAILNATPTKELCLNPEYVLGAKVFEGGPLEETGLVSSGALIHA